MRKRGQFLTPMAVISIAIYRKIKLKKALRTFMERPRQTITGMWKWGEKMMIHLKRNWPAKLLSLLAAIVMWFFIMRDQNPVMEVTYTVPVQVQNLDSHYIIEDAPDVARIVLSGPRDTIMAIKADNLRAYIDASGVKPGQNNVTIDLPSSGDEPR